MNKKLSLFILIFLFLFLLPIFAIGQINILDMLGDNPLNNIIQEPINLTMLELSWTADTYAPFDYDGRTLPVKGGMVTVSAYVKISSGNISSLKYSWFVDDTFQEAKSGYGKNSIIFGIRRDIGSSHNVLLKLFNDDRSFYIEKSIEIPVFAPELIIYSTNGNAHFSNQASKFSTIISNKKFSFVAKPYFFSIKKLTDLSFEWSLPGQEPIISSDYDASILDLTVQNATGLTGSIWVNVSNLKKSAQKAFQSVNLQIQ